MQNWDADAILLSIRKHGESGAVVRVLTRDYGIFGGYVRGGGSRKQRGILQVGNSFDAHWKARVSDHLGNLVLEPLKERAALVMHDMDRLAGLTAVTALTALSMPERSAYPALYEALDGLLDVIVHEGADNLMWGAALARYELGLLEELGFGLDFSRCAATGSTEDLIYVSPKSGRAVSKAAGEGYKAKLLHLPAFLRESSTVPSQLADVVRALRLTGYFLEHHVLQAKNAEMPEARRRLIARLSKEN
jgi:DNA repair protein RecO (recombination protein O)